MTDRERLAKILYEEASGSLRQSWDWLKPSDKGFWLKRADWFLDRGVTPPPEPPPPPKVWPEWKALREMAVATLAGATSDQSDSAYYTAIAAEGWRQMVKSLVSSVEGPGGIVRVGTTWVCRADLLALADGY